MEQGPVFDPLPKGDEGYVSIISSETQVLEEGDELRGWVIGMHEIETKDGKGYYFEILSDDKGIVRVSMSLGLIGLKAFVGKPVHCIIRCTGEQKTPNGSMKLWQVFGKKRELPELLALTTGDVPF